MQAPPDVLASSYYAVAARELRQYVGGTVAVIFSSLIYSLQMARRSQLFCDLNQIAATVQAYLRHCLVDCLSLYELRKGTIAKWAILRKGYSEHDIPT